MQVSNNRPSSEAYVNEIYKEGIHQTATELKNIVMGNYRDEPAAMHESVKVDLEVPWERTEDTRSYVTVYFCPDAIHDKVDVKGTLNELRILHQNAMAKNETAVKMEAHYKRFLNQVLIAVDKSYTVKDDVTGDSYRLENITFKSLCAIDKLATVEALKKSPTVHAIVYQKFLLICGQVAEANKGK